MGSLTEAAPAEAASTGVSEMRRGAITTLPLLPGVFLYSMAYAVSAQMAFLSVAGL